MAKPNEATSRLKFVKVLELQHANYLILCSRGTAIVKSAPLLNTVSYCGSKMDLNKVVCESEGARTSQIHLQYQHNIIRSFILVEAHERRDKFVGHFRKTEQDLRGSIERVEQN